jgi:hypothetical protein
MAGGARSVLGGDAAPAARLTGGGYRELVGQVPAAVLRAAYTAGLNRIFLASAALAAIAGVAVLVRLRPPVREPAPARETVAAR